MIIITVFKETDKWLIIKPKFGFTSEVGIIEGTSGGGVAICIWTWGKGKDSVVKIEFKDSEIIEVWHYLR